MAIKSDLTGASQKATVLKNATEQLLQTATVTSDTQTTITGNTNAQEAIQSAQNLSKLIAESVSVASQNIQSLAKEFEAFDKQAEIEFSQSIGGLN